MTYCVPMRSFGASMRDSGQDERAIHLHLYDIHHISSIIIQIATVVQSLVDTAI